MRRIFQFVRPYKLFTLFAVVLVFVELAVELFNPLLIGKIIDQGIRQQQMDSIINWGIVMVVLSLAGFVAGITNSFFSSYVCQHFAADIRQALFTKIQSFSYAVSSKFPTSSLITRMTNDITQLQNTLFMSLRIMLRAPLMVVGGTIMALIVNVKLASFLLLSVIILIVALSFCFPYISRFFKQVQEKLDNVNVIMRENLQAMRLIKAFNRSEHESDRFQRFNKNLKDKTTFALRTISTITPLLLFIMNISVLCILYFGYHSVTSSKQSIGEMVTLVNYVTRITASLSMFAMIITVFSRAKASANRVNEVFNTEDNQVVAGEKIVRIEGALRFQSISFQYQTSKDMVLQDINFEVKAGEKVAIMGATGSGKTSLLNLIPRLYDPECGNIYLDGKNITTFSVSSLREHISIVPQDITIFSGTIAENIAFGYKHATPEEIKRAAADAQLHDTISRLANGYDTVLGQKGVNLSGGQKQRLSIARALVRRPSILILDDSTSALDLQTEKRLLDALSEYHCTILVVTQKISTAAQMERVLLLENGTLLANDTHDKLLRENELYQQIYASQHKGEVLTNG